MDMVMVANMQGGRLITKYYINFPYLDGTVNHGPSMPIQYQRESFWRLQGDILGSTAPSRDDKFYWMVGW
jgi:hypothetical protein